jgi:hypothetical protein
VLTAIVTRNELALSVSAKRAPAITFVARESPKSILKKIVAELSHRIKIALDESRMLVLGTQVFLGFQFRAIFEPAFDRLPKSSQLLKMSGLMVLLIAITLIMAPGSYHRIVRGGSDAEDVHQFATTMMDVALVPFLLVFALDIYLSLGRIIGTSGGVIAGALIGAISLFFWYGFGWLSRSRHKPLSMPEKPKAHSTPLKTKIDQALTEARVVLPGAQALLGFQLVTMFMDGFDKLPNSSKFIHIGSLGLIALTTILLMTPAAFHRIAERGDDTRRFHQVASGLLVAAMITLPLGICGDLYVVVYKVTNSVATSITFATLALAFFYGTWFGYTGYKRAQFERGSN